MEKISKTGKNAELVLEEILKENNLNKTDIVYTKGETKKGLFKSETVEVIVYEKSKIYELVKQFLNEIITNLGLEVSFELTTKDNIPVIRIISNNNAILIGHNGNTLKSLEILARQKILIETGVYFLISLDVENYKDKKKAKLERLAKQTAKEVVRTNIKISLENMNAYERRIVHNALTNFKGVSTKSEGEEPNRHVVIYPEKD